MFCVCFGYVQFQVDDVRRRLVDFDLVVDVVLVVDEMCQIGNVQLFVEGLCDCDVVVIDCYVWWLVVYFVIVE